MWRLLYSILYLAAASASAAQTAEPADCLARSRALRNVTITDTEIVRGSPFRNETTSITFRLANPAAATDAACAANSTALTPNGYFSDPYLWYDCVVTPRASEENTTTRLRFQYDATLNYLTVNQTWVCPPGAGAGDKA